MSREWGVVCTTTPSWAGFSLGLAALTLSLGCLPDAGGFSEVDAGSDGGRPAADFGVDAARPDAGDAGVVSPDLGTPDAASDAGLDLGVDACVPDCITGGACGADDGCGGVCLGVCPNPDDEVCYGGVCTTVSWCVSSRCDVFSGTGCSSGDACHPTYADEPDLIETRCAPAGTGTDGAACTMPEDCAAGFGCRLGKCRRYCCHAGMLFGESSDHCLGYCERVGARTGFCVELCNTNDPSTCEADQLCIWSNERAGLTYCIETVAPDASPGDTCEFANACAHGQYCWEGSCRATCDPGAATPCATGACTTVLSTPGISVCLPE